MRERGGGGGGGGAAPVDAHLVGAKLRRSRRVHWRDPHARVRQRHWRMQRDWHGCCDESLRRAVAGGGGDRGGSAGHLADGLVGTGRHWRAQVAMAAVPTVVAAAVEECYCGELFQPHATVVLAQCRVASA